MGHNCVMITEFPCQVIKHLEIVVIVKQHCKYNSCHWIVCLNVVIYGEF